MITALLIGLSFFAVEPVLPKDIFVPAPPAFTLDTYSRKSVDLSVYREAGEDQIIVRADGSVWVSEKMCVRICEMDCQ